MNIIHRNNKYYRYESIWRPTVDDNSRDSMGNLFPWPNEGEYWQDKENFINKLNQVETYVKNRNNYEKYNPSEHKDCVLCEQKRITTGINRMSNTYWEDGLSHYISEHNIKPSDEFVDLINRYQQSRQNKKQTIIRFKGITYKKNEMSYIKLHRNQILIMDALMKHGGYAKKYMDHKKKFIVIPNMQVYWISTIMVWKELLFPEIQIEWIKATKKYFYQEM